MSVIPLTCPCCGANLTIDSEKDAAICEFCGKPFVVKDAIVQNYITNVTSITADTVNVYSQKDFDIKAGVLEHYNGESVDVVIPQSVIRIGAGAFAEMMIRSVIIPNGVTSIGIRAFFGCTNLDSINIPGGVVRIEDRTFSGCTNLASVVIPNRLMSIGESAFFGCVSLKKVSIPPSVMSIENWAFSGCTSLSSVVLPNNLRSIGDGAFSDCVKLTSVTIPNGIWDIDNVFHNTPWGTEWMEKWMKRQEQANWRKQGRCQNCGYFFKGVFVKKCENCGRPKDY